jgi:aquaporin Z
MVAIYAFGGVSGANFNPAVSFALGLTKTLGGDGIGMEWGKVAIYMGVQLLAAAMAGMCYFALFGHGFNLGPAKGFGMQSACICELAYTWMLCFVVLNVAVAAKNKKTPNEYFGLAIGFVIVAGAYGAGAISGGCFNPAVALGVATGSMDLSSFTAFFGYAFFELVGAALAVFFFKLVRPWEFQGSDAIASSPGTGAKLTAEFLGTYILVFTVGLNVLGKSPAGAFSIAASLMCMIYALGDVSGAHFNPAVTLAISIYGAGKDVGLYMLVQIAGAVLASITYAYIYYGETFPLGPSAGHTWTQASIAEIVFTFVLCLVVLCTAVVKETTNPTMNGLAIGSCVTVGGFAIGSISGGSLNPAVSLGIAAAHMLNGGFFFTALLYSAFEFVGAAAAAGVVMTTHMKSKDEGVSAA